MQRLLIGIESSQQQQQQELAGSGCSQRLVPLMQRLLIGADSSLQQQQPQEVTGSNSSQRLVPLMQRLLIGSDSSPLGLRAGSEGSLWVVLMLVEVLLLVGS